MWLPLLVADLFLLTLAQLLCRRANVFYEDIKFILNLVMGFLFYLMPIIYFAENVFYSPRIPGDPAMVGVSPVPGEPAGLADHRVQAGLLRGRRHLEQQCPASSQFQRPVRLAFSVLTTVSSLLVCLWGYSFFNRHKWKFTERP